MEQAVDPKKPNQRRAPRSKPRGSIKLECRKGAMGLGSNLATSLMDISETGARLVINQELPVPQEVEVTFTGYGLAQTIKRLAHVRWQVKLDEKKFCIGVQFQKRLEYRDLLSIASPNMNA